MRSRPFHARPFEDELFSSWLVRLSLGNMCKPHTLSSLLLDNTEVWTRDIDRSASSALLMSVAQISQEFNDIDFTAHTLQFYNRCFDGGVSRNATNIGILPLGIYHRLRTLGGLQYCPRCLAQDSDPYYRRHWRLTVHFMCETHQCYLMSTCSMCKRPLMPHRLDFSEEPSLGTCANCSHYLPDTTILPTSAIGKGIQSILSKMIVSGYINVAKQKIDCLLFLQGYFQLMKLLLHWSKEPAICSRLEALLEIDLKVVRDFQSDFKHLEYVICPIVRMRLAEAVFVLIDNWPSRFVDIMADINMLSSTLRKSRKSLPFWIDSVINEYLFRPNLVTNKRKQYL